MSRSVYIIDDDAAFRIAIGRLLRAHGYATEEFETADHFLENLYRLAVGCILLDMRMPGLSGTDLQTRLTDSGNRFPIIFLTGYGDVPTTVRAIKAGAEDFLTKPVCGTDLLVSIEKSLARYETERTRLEWLCEAGASLASLTPREREVFDYVVRGKFNKQTANALGITERTIKAHRQRIFGKLGVHSVAELVSLAERLGVVVNDPANDPVRSRAQLR